MQLDSNTPIILASNTRTTPTIDDALESRILTSDLLAKKASRTYNLRLWMDEDTPVEEGSGKFFYSKIVVKTNLSDVQNVVLAFNTNGGSSVDNKTVSIGTKAGTLPEPTKRKTQKSM